MSDENPTHSTSSDPPIFEKLSLKTQGYLRQATSSKNKEEKGEPSKMTTEQTFIAIKPDGVQRGLIGPIISRFENRGYKLVAIKMCQPGEAHLKEHYSDLSEKPFFKGLVTCATNPLDSLPGTIRGDFAIDVGRNVCHGSDSVENAKKEIKLWFAEATVKYDSAQFGWIYEKA
ncbi:nucleoside diphosphate kinase [Bacidia gigantensis]|uniref:nucleoside diphosphate kinase n=1 Tax=Bacidia gigantensis TaxID=2732470 RepID=UPI001D05338A|nr:nucleoside diphosphate kinase [Bacidia gigantensis]KAG8529776.1 nucleoside diphosphate kinase [Bacidia gigantensis]